MTDTPTRTIVLIPAPDDLLVVNRPYWDNFVHRAILALERDGLEARIVVAEPKPDISPRKKR